MSLKRKLDLYDSYLAEENNLDKGSNKKDEPFHLPFEKEWRKHGIVPYQLDHQYCLIKERRYPLSEKRGNYSYADFLVAMDAWQKTSISHPLSAKGYKGEDLFFFDTETTGLGGGVGNTIFLLGYAYIDGDEVVVKQHLLPEPGHEIPLYDSFLRNIDYTTLVTYNGKAFDWPQVKTRHTLIREHVPNLPPFGHFDLLHGARRMWKHRLDSVSLSNVEREILNIDRKSDLPGYLAPMAYFDFLKTKNPEGILQVMEHNEQDVLTLIILYTHLSFKLLGLDHHQTEGELLSLGTWYSQLKETKVAIPLLEKGMTKWEGTEKWRGMIQLAHQYKKIKNYRKALVLYKQIAESSEGKIRISASIEGAKILEHQYKDYKGALELANMAYREWSETKETSFRQKEREEMVKRIERLEKKIARHGENFI
ncbi:ribonuclease H-like domain-containing protein [Fervidibacillus halotolerans]|uniref:Ribonuclease H-like domain-containing protein n=1 Tax=Fervidibacillus halotolerans TaxID=2980027 RepID=A0A9E8M1C0_9BACI|nr:ribonuclease H-like domain-containing protein [Fervidibacillus halotolerans]WAA13723.1 ribonuclease H-like domain-containing protein [Fervidibacillus halotolerans]